MLTFQRCKCHTVATRKFECFVVLLLYICIYECWSVAETWAEKTKAAAIFVEANGTSIAPKFHFWLTMWGVLWQQLFLSQILVLCIRYIWEIWCVLAEVRCSRQFFFLNTFCSLHLVYTWVLVSLWSFHSRWSLSLLPLDFCGVHHFSSFGKYFHGVFIVDIMVVLVMLLVLMLFLLCCCCW